MPYMVVFQLNILKIYNKIFGGNKSVTTLTIFTPTYNRQETLQKSYNSLVTQTNKDFEWLIIDDGSKDGTEKLVEKWIDEKKIKITYKKKTNGGKASCINMSLIIVETPLWLCLDSDDYMTNNAVEIILNNYQEIKDKDNICGLFALRSNPSGRPMQNKSIPQHIQYSTQSYIRYNLNIPPEYLHVYKTHIIKNYKYPIIENENFMPLSYVFDQIDQKYKYKILHFPVMICEYQLDGMTKNKRELIKKNPEGYKIYKKQAISYAPNIKEKVKAAITYNTACIMAQKGNWLSGKNKILIIACLPFGLLDYLLRYSRISNFDN